MVSATSRLEVRMRIEARAKLERAAALEHVTLSDFVRTSAELRADAVLIDHESHTSVPEDFYDSLLDALEAPPQPNAALRRAARRASKLAAR